MSWQTYVDDHLMCDVDGVHLFAAAIIGLDGSVFAQSSAFPQFKSEDVAYILKELEEPGFLAPTGLHFGSAKYVVIGGDNGFVVRGKRGTGGIIIKKTCQTLIIGIFEEPMILSTCNMIVEKTGAFLIDQGM